MMLPIFVNFSCILCILFQLAIVIYFSPFVYSSSLFITICLALWLAVNGLETPTRNEKTPDPSGVLWRKNKFDPQKPLDGFYNITKFHHYLDDSWLSIVKDPAGGKGDVMKVFKKKDNYVFDIYPGAETYTSVVSPRDSMTLSYDVYFQKGMDFGIGGMLPGIFGTNYNGTGIYDFGECLSTRFYWRKGGKGELKTNPLLAEDQVKDFCNSTNIYCSPWTSEGISVGQGTWSFKTGQWENIAQHIHLNTPGQKDGYAIIWINGKKVYEIHNFNFRNHANIQLRGLFFSVLVGYSQFDSNIYLRNFVLSSNENYPSQLVG